MISKGSKVRHRTSKVLLGYVGEVVRGPYTNGKGPTLYKILWPDGRIGVHTTRMIEAAIASDAGPVITIESDISGEVRQVEFRPGESQAAGKIAQVFGKGIV